MVVSFHLFRMSKQKRVLYQQAYDFASHFDFMKFLNSVLYLQAVIVEMYMFIDLISWL